MERITTKEVIKIPCFLLNNDIRKNVLSILKVKEGTCTSKGCIVKIVSLDNIYEAKTCPYTSDVYFKIEFTYEIFKPQINCIYNAVVYKCYPEQNVVLVDIEGYPQIKIMINNSPNFINIGDNVNVLIIDIKCNNCGYIGFGNIE